MAKPQGTPAKQRKEVEVLHRMLSTKPTQHRPRETASATAPTRGLRAMSAWRKRRLLAAVAAAAAAALMGCATRQPPSAADQTDAYEPLVCVGPAQCQTAWRRAQLWLVDNSHWKIQIATEVVIETYNGDPYTPFRHYVLTREPLGGDRERIKIASGCPNTYGCSTDEIADAARFKRYVRAGMQP